MAEKIISLSLLRSYDGELKKYIQNLLNATNGDVEAVQALVDTLIGEDNGKSARTIANEELAKQLIPENAKEALDTLQEIAAWIQQHPDDVATMNASIQANAKAVEDEAKRAGDAEDELSGRLDVIEGEGDGSVKKALADAKSYTDGHALSATNASQLQGQAEPVTVTLGGTVNEPTIAVAVEFATAEEVMAIANPATKPDGSEEAGEQEPADGKE